jgi:hypothetical protein
VPIVGAQQQRPRGGQSERKPFEGGRPGRVCGAGQRDARADERQGGLGLGEQAGADGVSVAHQGADALVQAGQDLPEELMGDARGVLSGALVAFRR